MESPETAALSAEVWDRLVIHPFFQERSFRILAVGSSGLQKKVWWWDTLAKRNAAREEPASRHC